MSHASLAYLEKDMKIKENLETFARAVCSFYCNLFSDL